MNRLLHCTFGLLLCKILHIGSLFCLKSRIPVVFLSSAFLICIRVVVFIERTSSSASGTMIAYMFSVHLSYTYIMRLPSLSLFRQVMIVLLTKYPCDSVRNGYPNVKGWRQRDMSLVMALEMDIPSTERCDDDFGLKRQR